MRIVMVTNSFTPHVSGVARSVETLRGELQQQGHRVLVVAPKWRGQPPREADVVRVPAIQNLNGSDFPVRIPIPGVASRAIADFSPDIVHSHHPFLLGDTALRIAARWDRPLVFTQHSLYENFTHYIPGDSTALKRFVIELATGYANLCDRVFAPSESLAATLRDRGVTTPLGVVPTGIDIRALASGDGARVRLRAQIPGTAFVVGHVGRLAPEKNVIWLMEALRQFMTQVSDAHFVVAGDGLSRQDMERRSAAVGLKRRVHFLGTVQGAALAAAYASFDVFAFASHTETQGLVLVEALAAGVPVVALEATGVCDVVRDGVNGRLLPREDRLAYVAALKALRAQTPLARQAMRAAARATAAAYDRGHCAAVAVQHYEQVMAHKRSRLSHAVPGSMWEAARRRLEAEWKLQVVRTQAATSMLPTAAERSRIRAWWPRVRPLIDRHEWVIRLLRLTRAPLGTTAPGVVIVQIDGLSRRQCERALAQHRLPFLRRLLTRRHQLLTLYSGLPSTTPAVQGELFYGVVAAVPSFYFRDPALGQVVPMYDPGTAARVQARLAQGGEGLLVGGSSYAAVYSGGAAETHYCPAEWGWASTLKTLNPWRLTVFMVFFPLALLKVVALMIGEGAVAVVDFARGLIGGQHFWRELWLVPARVFVCILLRELVSIGAQIDAARGLPAIYVNLIGYDKQAHRRGPSSALAHWSLKGIDATIRRIWGSARHSPRRRYHLWVYSDHGQVRSVPYDVLTGRTIEEAVADVLGERTFAKPAPAGPEPRGSVSAARKIRGIQGEVAPPVSPQGNQPVLVTTNGPLDHLYPTRPLGETRREVVAWRLVHEARIPLVLSRDGRGGGWAWTASGRWHLPEAAAAVLGTAHPLLTAVTRDLLKVLYHEHSGELLISGWQVGRMPITFGQENGAHGGPAAEEVQGFVLWPRGAADPPRGRPYVRAGDMRQAILSLLHPSRAKAPSPSSTVILKKAVVQPPAFA